MELSLKELQNTLAETRENLNLYIFQRQIEYERHLDAKRSFIKSSDQHKKSIQSLNTIYLREKPQMVQIECRECMEIQTRFQIAGVDPELCRGCESK